MHAFDLSPSFTPDAALAALLAGLMVGLTVAFKTGLCGGVLGLAGITTSFMGKPCVRKAAFVLGLMLSGMVQGILERSLEQVPREELSSDRYSQFLVRLALGGFLMGFGASVGDGCTCSHFFTGLARRSRRSLLAVVLSVASAMLTATFTHTSQVVPCHPDPDDEPLVWNEHLPAIAGIAVIGALVVLVATAVRCRFDVEGSQRLKPVAELLAGYFFGAALGIARVLRPSVSVAFLDVGAGTWDPTVGVVLCGGILVTLPFFCLLERSGSSQPLLGGSFDLPADIKTVSRGAAIGSALFGMGWGLTGMCPAAVWMLACSDEGAEVLLIWTTTILGMAMYWFGRFLHKAWVKSSLAKEKERRSVAARHPIEDERSWECDASRPGSCMWPSELTRSDYQRQGSVKSPMSGPPEGSRDAEEGGSRQEGFKKLRSSLKSPSQSEREDHSNDQEGCKKPRSFLKSPPQSDSEEACTGQEGCKNPRGSSKSPPSSESEEHSNSQDGSKKPRSSSKTSTREPLHPSESEECSELFGKLVHPGAPKVPPEPTADEERHNIKPPASVLSVEV